MTTQPPPLLTATSNQHKLEEFRAIFSQFSLAVRGLHQAKPIDPSQAAFIEPKEVGRTFIENATIKALSYAEQSGCVCIADDSGLEIDALNGRPGVISSHYSTDGTETGLSREQRDAANNARVLRELHGVPIEKRSARFMCVMVLAAPPTLSSGASASDGRVRRASQNAQGWSVPDAMRSAQPYDAPNDDLNNLKARLDSIDREPDQAHVLLVSSAAFEGRIGTPPRVPSGKHGFGYDPLFLVAHPTAPSGDKPTPFSQTGAELDPETKNRLSHRAKAANVMIDLILRSGLLSASL